MKLNKKLHGHTHEGGFTLVEMLLVVAIIATIVSIAVPAMRDMKSDAKIKKRSALTYAIQYAKERAVINGDMPSTGWAKWNQFGKYVQVNGITNPTLTEITMAEKNGTGQNIWHWGSQSTGGVPVLFGDTTPAITDPNYWTYTP